MFKKVKYTVKTIVSLLVIVAGLFCVLFGQGTHFHDIAVHIGSHFDIHAHVHAHQSYDEPFQTDNNQEENSHQHEVETASDIIGTLTSQIQVRTDIKIFAVVALFIGSELADSHFNETPTLFDLPPPRPPSNQYHFSSYSYRGPPIA